MKLMILVISSLYMFSCSNGSSSDSSVKASAAAPDIYGTWYYQAPGATDTQVKGIVATIDNTGNIEYLQVYAITDVSGNNAKMYFRRSKGNYTKNGDLFNIHYAYETCNPVGSEKLKINLVNDKLLVKAEDDSFSYILARVDSKSTVITMSTVEDKNCNILSKLQSKQTRKIASTPKNKSFFDNLIFD